MIETPQLTRTAEQPAAVLHLTVPREQIRQVMGPGYREVMTAVAAQGIAPAGPWFRHHLRMDPSTFDFEIGVPAARVAWTVYHGPYEGLASAWAEFEAWITAEGHTPVQICGNAISSVPNRAPTLSPGARSSAGRCYEGIQIHRARAEREAMKATVTYELHPVGWVRSSLKRSADAPKQGSEGAPDARVQIQPAFVAALDGITPGQHIVLLTWLHEAERDALAVHPRGDSTQPLAGVFATRSPSRPNPIGLHRVKVLDVQEDGWLHVQPLEAIDGTPVIDIKPVLDQSRDW